MNVNRSSQLSAIVIRISPFGEHHGMVDLLTDSAGLTPTVAYGLRSKRSSLRGKIVPFARGTAWLYRDPRQERGKITDFAVDRYALNIAGNLDAYYEASLWAEVVWRSHGSGEFGGEVFNLLATALELLDDHPEESSLLGTVVLWRYLAVMGLQPDPAAARGIDGGGIRFLTESARRPLSEMRMIGLSDESRGRLRRFVVAAIQDAVEAPLNTLKVSAGLRGIS